MESRCIACGLVIEAGWLRMMTPLGELCIPDSVPEYRVRVGNTAHLVIAWTPELLEKIKDYQQSPEALALAAR
jgi:hypothetical protein